MKCKECGGKGRVMHGNYDDVNNFRYRGLKCEKCSFKFSTYEIYADVYKELVGERKKKPKKTKKVDYKIKPTSKRGRHLNIPPKPKGPLNLDTLRQDMKRKRMLRNLDNDT